MALCRRPQPRSSNGNALGKNVDVLRTGSEEALALSTLLAVILGPSGLARPLCQLLLYLGKVRSRGFRRSGVRLTHRAEPLRHHGGGFVYPPDIVAPHLPARRRADPNVSLVVGALYLKRRLVHVGTTLQADERATKGIGIILAFNTAGSALS